jgi:glycosyltransferase involved in cell wall biosynthesis
VIVAARNEAETIEATLGALAAALPGAELIVADDASADGTADAARRGGARVVRGQRRRGKGGNVTEAARELLRETTGEPTVILCDADLGQSAGALVALAESVESGECDLAVAKFARHEGGGFGIAVEYARQKIEELCGFKAEAPISGQRAMSAGLLSELLPFADGWGMEMAMTVDAVRAGRRVAEIELPLEHRATGRSPAGFLHRAAQLRSFVRVYRDRA